MAINIERDIMNSTFLPRFTMGIGAFTSIKDFINENSKVAILYGNKAYQASKLYIDEAIEQAHLNVLISENYGHEATYENVENILNLDHIQEVEALIAVGGGKCIDTVKYVGNELNIPVYTFPTIASTCAAVTKISIMYHSDGSFKDIPQLKQPPVHCFIEPRIIAQAPIQYLWAGIGDTMAKHVESVFSARNDVLDYASELGIKIGENCFYPILRDGEKALNDAKKHEVTQELEKVIENIIITTGSVSLAVHPKYNSALAHALFYGLTLRKHIEKNHLHGEVVSYGTLVQLMMDKQFDMLEKTYQFHKKIGLPTCLSDLELNIQDDLTDILEKAECNTELEHVPYPVTQKRILDAIKELEIYGGNK